MFPAGALWRKPKPIQCGRVMNSMLCAVKGENARIFNDKVLAFFCVVPLGFEPGLAEPKSDVLPLHHGTILNAS